MFVAKELIIKFGRKIASKAHEFNHVPKRWNTFNDLLTLFFSTKFGLKRGYGGYSNWSIIFFLFRPNRIYFVYYGLVAINSQFFLSLSLTHSNWFVMWFLFFLLFCKQFTFILCVWNCYLFILVTFKKMTKSGEYSAFNCDFTMLIERFDIDMLLVNSNVKNIASTRMTEKKSLFVKD